MLYKKKIKKPGLFVFAHRGASQLFTENSIESIQKAIDLGCDGIEVDIQTTKDNKIILFHDDYIMLNHKKFWIRNITRRQISSITRKQNTQALSEFGDLLKIILQEKEMVFNLEIKSKTINNHQILTTIKNAIPENVLKDRCIVSSFNFFVLLQHKFILKLSGPIAIIVDAHHTNGWLKRSFFKLLILLLKPQFLHVSIDGIDKNFLNFIKAQKIIINTYTINNEKQIQKSIEYGFNGIFTDNQSLYN